MGPLKLEREMFSLLPDEIWNLFIFPFNNAESSIFDNHSRGRWFVHFGGLSIADFANLQWTHISHPLTEIIDQFDSFTSADVEDAIKFILSDDTPETRALFPGYDPSTRKTVADLVKFIEVARRLPAPIVGIRTPAGLKILDGYHRLIAALYVEEHHSISLDIDIWIGE